MDGRLSDAGGWPLRPHPGAAAPPAGVRVALARAADGGLSADFVIDAPPGTLAVPAAGESLPADRLWAYTCCELFLARAGSPAYREYNFSPSGQWAGWSFADYRQRDAAAPPLPAPRLDWQRGATLLRLQLVLPAAALPPGSGALELSPTVVVCAADGRVAHFARAHPRAQADFHDRGAFATLGD